MADETRAPKYLAEAVICLSCEEKAAAADAAAKDAGKPQHGMYWSVSAQRRANGAS